MARRTKRDNFQIDLDEIAPNTFIVHNARMHPYLKGEGVRVGHTFELLTERRAGLIARLQSRGFNVRTFASRVKRLPRLPQPIEYGPQLQREISPKEQWSVFSEHDLRWHTLKPTQVNGKPHVDLRVGQVVRRRRSRAGGDFFQITLSAEHTPNLLALSADEAILHGYAQATASSDIEVETAEHAEGYELIIDYVLPQAYLDLFQRLGSKTTRGVLIPNQGWGFALLALHRLNLRPEHGDASISDPDVDPTFHADTYDDDDDDDDE